MSLLAVFPADWVKLRLITLNFEGVSGQRAVCVVVQSRLWYKARALEANITVRISDKISHIHRHTCPGACRVRLAGGVYGGL